MALIKARLNVGATCTPGETGQFDVIADGEKVADRGGNWFTRRFGAGYPDFQKLIEKLRAHAGPS